MKEKIKTYSATKNGWTVWIQPTEFYKLVCCNCNFAHELEFRIKNKKIQFRVREKLNKRT